MHANFGWLDALILGLVQGLTEFLPSPPAPTCASWALCCPAMPIRRSLHRHHPAGHRAGGADLFPQRRVAHAHGLAGFAARIGSRRAGEPLHGCQAGLAGDLGTIPICVLGLLLRDFIETTFRTLALTAVMLIVFGLLLGWAERRGSQTRTIAQLGVKGGVLLGLAQAMALIPGVSRSGGTITVALLLGLTREAAARFSFLLAIPAVLLSGFYMLLFKREPMTPDQWGMTLAATFIAFVVGYAVIVWFMRLISHKGFTFFVVYRVVLGLLILAGLYFGLIQ
jgi:undecaprenyl-diphosphatase